MKTIHINQNEMLRDEISSQKYSFVSAENFNIPSELLSDFKSLKADWENLEADEYLKAGGSFRFRRFGLFEYLQPRI